jgi:methylthioribose-1-phosphate isomerase
VITPLEWINGKLRFLDQTRLPLEEFYCETDEVDVIVDAIKRLAIRGAPLIGIAAAYGVASLRTNVNDAIYIRKHLMDVIKLLESTRPTAVNLFWALQRQSSVLIQWKTNSIADLQKQLLAEAKSIHQEDVEMCEHISSLGAELLPFSCNVLTHCNTGRLATGGRGTALGIITKAWELGRIKHVYIGETRPLLQGARLTAWEIKKWNIPATLITDNTAAYLIQKGKIDVVIVGADRIAMNGDVANKIGTYNLAVLAAHHKIPFYVAAPVSTIDFQVQTGSDITVEERNGREVTEVFGLKIAPEGMGVYSPAFDITPNKYISAIITNLGVLHSPFNDSLQNLRSRGESAH